MKLELEDLSEDKLYKQLWGFYFCDSYSGPIIYLDYYQELKKESTKKHKWEVIRQYQRLGRTRDFYNNTMKVEEVPFDELIKITIRDKFADMIQVKLWDKK
jgi:hypothetical protein